MLFREDDSLPMIGSRRRLLQKGAWLAALGLGAGSALLPDPAFACHQRRRRKAGCDDDKSFQPDSPNEPETPPTPGGAEWSYTIGNEDVGRDPRDFFNASNDSWKLLRQFSPKHGSTRIALGRAPDGRPSLQVNIPKGINWNNTFETAPFGSRGVDAAVLELEIWLENGFSWGSSDGKLGFGLWGGNGGDHSGGVPVRKQDGFSVRNVRGSDHQGGGIALYSYHLNRRSGRWGQVSQGRSAGLPEGRWFKVALEVHMNNGNNNDGSAKLSVDGNLVSDWRNLKFRRNNNVGIRGLMFTDMWGGNENRRSNWSPKRQTMWYSNYHLRAI